MKIKSIKIKANKTEYPIRLFDSNGNELYREYSDGYYVKKQYDSNGNDIYFEDSNGSWQKREYDSNDNLVYHENSEGYWAKKEFDSKNNLIYFEDSKGDFEDRRPKPIKEMTVEEISKRLGYDIKIIKG